MTATLRVLRILTLTLGDQMSSDLMSDMCQASRRMREMHCRLRAHAVDRRCPSRRGIVVTSRQRLSRRYV